MGVHGLISFMASHGQHFESLRDAIVSRGKKQLLIDGPCLMYHLCSSDASVLLTTEYAALAREMHAFCTSLMSCGAELVFFFDGVSSEKKRRTQIKRRREDVRVICTLNAMATSKASSSAKKPVGRILPVLLKEVLLGGYFFVFLFFNFVVLDSSVCVFVFASVEKVRN